MFSICTVSINFGIEVAYPVGEAYTVGVLWCSGSVFCIIFSVVATSLLSHIEDKVLAVRVVYSICATLCLTATIFSFFVKEDLRRLRLEWKKLAKRFSRGEEDRLGSFRRTRDDSHAGRPTANFNED